MSLDLSFTTASKVKEAKELTSKLNAVIEDLAKEGVAVSVSTVSMGVIGYRETFPLISLRLQLTKDL